MKLKEEIFFSYAWGDEQEQGESREAAVTELYEYLLKNNYNVVRDKHQLGYKGFITDFMKRIGRGKCIVIAISKKYTQSPFCMFELYEIARHSNFDKYKFRQKVLPISVEFIDFSKQAVADAFLTHWHDEYHKWLEIIKTRTGQIAIEKMERFDRIRSVYQQGDKLMEWMANMNLLSPKLLFENDFAELKKELTKMLSVGEVQNYSEQQHPAPSTKENMADSTGEIAGHVDYKPANIRKFLANALSDTDFNTLCMDYFPEVYSGFAESQNKLQKINFLLDFCRRNIKFSSLLDAMKEINAVQFEVYKPYA